MPGRLIDADALLRDIKHYHVSDGMLQHWVEIQPTVDAVPVVHGKWKFTPHAYYRDTFSEERELCVYISANCSVCGKKHPDNAIVYSRTLEPPYGEEYDYEWDLEKEKINAMIDFKSMKHEFANYCPNCGAKIDGGTN